MTQVGISEKLAKTKVSHLSAGQRKRTSLAALLIKEAGLWLLDEPHAGVDEDGRTLIDGLITDFRLRGGTVLMASHELERAVLVSDKSFTVSGGAVTDEENYKLGNKTASTLSLPGGDFYSRSANGVFSVSSPGSGVKAVFGGQTGPTGTGNTDVA